MIITGVYPVSKQKHGGNRVKKRRRKSGAGVGVGRRNKGVRARLVSTR